MSADICFAQISDCHLYADKKALHYGANVFNNLCLVLKKIEQTPAVQFIIFTGDLTQDHSELSYKNFVEAVELAKITQPIYFLAGNHDEPGLLAKYLNKAPFINNKSLEFANWQIQLLDSKSETPSGFISRKESERLLLNVNHEKFQLFMMHHHAIDVGYFIDRHALTNQDEFKQLLAGIEQLKAVACGHIHNALELIIDTGGNKVPLYTCPATSIQFDISADTVANSGKSAGYRIYSLFNNGKVESQAVFIY